MIQIVTLAVSRDDYNITEVASQSITVGELIDELKRLDEDAKIVFSNDNGYTYGIVDSSVIDTDLYETREEEREREEREQLDDDMHELQEELTELQAEYENPEDDDEPMTEEEYRETRARLFESYNITEEEYNAYNF